MLNLDFNEKLRSARKELGVTQKQAALALGTGERNYQHYEAGTQKPSFDVIIKICQFLNISSDYLLGLDSEPRPLRSAD